MFPRPSSISAGRALRIITRQASYTAPRTQPARTVTSSRLVVSSTCSHSTSRLNRGFHLSATFRKGISPESPDPRPESRQEGEHVAKPAPISTEDYHKAADEYINELVHKLEQLQEEKGDMDCEYSVRPFEQDYNSSGIALRSPILLGRCSQHLLSSDWNLRPQQAASE